MVLEVQISLASLQHFGVTLWKWQLIKVCNVQISCSVHMAAAEPNRQAIRVPVGEESGEEGWSYPIIALRNPVQNLIRIYGQYSVKIIG